MDAGTSAPNFSKTIDAGITYFGQFLDQNITFQADATFDLGTCRMPGPIDTPLGWPANEPTDSLRSIAVRNFLRARPFGLPSGQSVAAHLGLTPLSQADIGLSNSGLTEAPRWYYVMAEALAQTDGATLGQVGSRIVGDVFFGLLLGDPSSYLSVYPNGTPTLGTDGSFSITDLLKIAGVHP